MAVASLVFLGILGAVVALSSVIMPYDPNRIDLQAAPMGKPQPPSPTHWLGVDNYGRDVLSRVISGGRVSLQVGVIATGIALAFGVMIGALAGYLGGIADSVLMRTLDIFLSIPSFFVILTLNAYLKPSIFNIMAIISLFGWMTVARLVRGALLQLKEQEFVMAAHALGVPGFRLVLRHLLPNAMGPVIVAATIGVPYAILTESALSFLGLGVPAPHATWGSMLNLAKPWLADAWWMWLPPGVMISLTVFSFNFIGDGIRDALDPVQHGGKNR